MIGAILYAPGKREGLFDGKQELVCEQEFPNKEEILAAFKQLFSNEKGKVRRFSRSGLHFLGFSGDTTLIEQNPSKQSRWAQQVRQGHQIAWLMKERRYLARVVNGEIQFLVPQAGEGNVF